MLTQMIEKEEKNAVTTVSGGNGQGIPAQPPAAAPAAATVIDLTESGDEGGDVEAGRAAVLPPAPPSP